MSDTIGRQGHAPGTRERPLHTHQRGQNPSDQADAHKGVLWRPDKDVKALKPPLLLVERVGVQLRGTG